MPPTPAIPSKDQTITVENPDAARLLRKGAILRLGKNPLDVAIVAKVTTTSVTWRRLRWYETRLRQFLLWWKDWKSTRWPFVRSPNKNVSVD